MKSLGQKIQALIDFSINNSASLSVWEFDFINSIDDRTSSGKRTTQLSSKQVEVIDRIYSQKIGE